MRRKRYLISIIFIVLSVGPLFLSFSQTLSLQEWVSIYEHEMEQGVLLWKNKQYGGALDRLHTAQTVITENMPLPAEHFKWYAGLSMKTYVLVLIRMIELEMKEKEENPEAVRNRTIQICEWGEKLQDQAKSWRLVENVSPPDSVLRETWIRRYLAALKRVKTLSQRLTEKYPEKSESQ
jgi:hypothetical protein